MENNGAHQLDTIKPSHTNRPPNQYATCSKQACDKLNHSPSIFKPNLYPLLF